jgi:hypothetical protein
MAAATPPSIEGRVVRVDDGGTRWEMELLGLESGPVGPEGYREIRLSTSRGDVLCRHYPTPGATRGALWVPGEHVEQAALTGHSFGGAVVIQAGVASVLTRTVVTLSTQGYGAGVVGELPDDCAILLVHGTDDEILPPSSSEGVFARAHEPKQLMLYPGANHNLDQVAAEVHDLVRDWITEQLSPREGGSDAGSS